MLDNTCRKRQPSASRIMISDLRVMAGSGKDLRHSEGLPVEEREEGGLGIHLVRKSFDRIEYAYEDFQGKKANILSLWLKLV